MNASLGFFVVGLLVIAASPILAWAQPPAQRVDRAAIENVIREQRENATRKSQQIAEVVKQQLQINHPDDPVLAKQMFESWKLATGVTQHVEETAARASAARNSAANSSDRQQHNEKLRTALTEMRRIHKQMGHVIDHVERLVEDKVKAVTNERQRQVMKALDDAANRKPSTSTASEDGLDLPKEEDLRQLFQPDAMDRVRMSFDDILLKEILEDIRRTSELAAASDLAGGTSPGTVAGTDPERFLQASHDAWERAPTTGGSADNARDALNAPTRIPALLRQLAAIQARIDEHNSRLSQFPTMPWTKEQSDQWEPVRLAYNAEAEELDEAQSSLLAQVDTESQ